MPQIMLTDDQARLLEDATEPVELLNSEGRVLAKVLSPLDAQMVQQSKQRLAAGGPSYPGHVVQARLRKLEEISKREVLDAEKVASYLLRMRAGEEV